MNIHFISIQSLFCGAFLASKWGQKHRFSGAVPPSRERGKNAALSSNNTFFWELTFRFGQQGTPIGGLSALRWRSSRPSRSPGSVLFWVWSERIEATPIPSGQRRRVRPERCRACIFSLMLSKSRFPVFTSFSQRHFLIILRHELFYCCSYFAINYISF